MTALQKGTPLYDEVFGGDAPEGEFVAKGPTYGIIENAFTNPANLALLTSEEVVRSQQAQDIRDGMRFIAYDLVVDFGDGAVVNLPSTLLKGVQQITQSSKVGSTLSSSQVTTLFTAVAGGDPKKIAGAIIGVGLAALSLSLPVVGLVGAAIIGLAAGIAAAVNRSGALEEANLAERRERLYRSFPPLQSADSELDSNFVNVLIRPRLRTRDYTPIFLPQYDSENGWVGVERKGGFAFAPGDRDPGGDKFGGFDVFKASPRRGLGVIPGTTEVTSVIQVSLVHDPDADGHEAWSAFANGTGPDPRGVDINGVKGYTRVLDTGVYLSAAGRLGGSIWDLCTATPATARGLTEADRKRMRVHGNAMRYRLDIAELHDAWSRYMSSGIRYIREVCYPWYAANNIGEGKIDTSGDANFEGFFGTAVAQAVLVFGGVVAGGTSTKPKYKQYPSPNGFSGPQLAGEPAAYGWPHTRIWSSNSGAFLPILDPSEWPDELMFDRYSRGPLGVSIKDTLDVARKSQEWELGHTLVSAYVSSADVAFATDDKLRERLWRLRAVLLQHKDRMAIDMNDVGIDELGVPDLPNSHSWREQLLAAGVPERPSQFLPDGDLGLAGANTGGPPPNYCEAGVVCPDEPEPKRPNFQPMPADPWEPSAGLIKPFQARPAGRTGGGGLALLLGLAGLGTFGTALYAASQARQKPTRSFTGGRLSPDDEVLLR